VFTCEAWSKDELSLNGPSPRGKFISLAFLRSLLTHSPGPELIYKMVVEPSFEETKIYIRENTEQRGTSLIHVKL
jgi:hypothetical protein